MTPVRVRHRDADAGCDVLRGVGFRAETPGVWRGPIRRTRSEAAEDARQRRAEVGNTQR